MPIPAGLIVQGASILGNLIGKKTKGQDAGKGAAVGMGLAQGVVGAIQRKRAEALLPPSENVMERQMLQSIRRRRRALETGTAGAADRAAIRQMGKSFGRQQFAAGGRGNFGQMAALQSQAMQNLAASYGQQISQQMALEQKQTSGMADVARDLALLRSNRMSALAEQNIRDSKSNVSLAMGGKGGEGGAFDKSYNKTRTRNNNPSDDGDDDAGIPDVG